MHPVLIAIAVDLTAVAVVVLSTWLGWGRQHAGHRLGGLGGALFGIVAAFFITPPLGRLVSGAVVAALVSAIVCTALALIGHFVGARIAGAVSKRNARHATDAAPVRTPRTREHAVAALAYGVVAILLVSMIVLATGHVATTVAPRSLSLRVVHAIVPAAVVDAYAAMSSTPEAGTSFRVISAISNFERLTPSATPNPDDVTDEVTSIVKVMGTVWACEQGIFGTGLVVAPERVVTNAHVVAGMDEVIVTGPGNFAVEGSIVYFDPRHDLAIIAVPGLNAEPLEFDDTGVEGEDAIVAGYPHGGSFSAAPAFVQARTTGVTTNIYGTEGVVLEYLTIVGSVPPGTSGSPLLTFDGRVAGLVFARSDESNTTGYALAVRHLEPVVERAADYIIKVDTGPCLPR